MPNLDIACVCSNRNRFFASNRTSNGHITGIRHSHDFAFNIDIAVKGNAATVFYCCCQILLGNNVFCDMDIAIRCFGEYSYKMADPMLFYKNVCGNVSSDYRRDQIESQLKTELLTALQPAFAKISEQGIRYSALPGHTDDLADALNDVLSEKWAKLRGLEVVSFGVSSVKANEEDEKRIKELQANAALKDPAMAAAHLTGATAAAMQSAAANEGSMGAAMGFMGMNMAQNATAGNINSLYGMASQNSQPAAAAAGWTCPKCGTVNTGKFCSECGSPKPAPAEWVCAKCGTKNTGKFCSECGAPRE